MQQKVIVNVFFIILNKGRDDKEERKSNKQTNKETNEKVE